MQSVLLIAVAICVYVFLQAFYIEKYLLMKDNSWASCLVIS